MGTLRKYLIISRFTSSPIFRVSPSLPPIYSGSRLSEVQPLRASEEGAMMYLTYD